MVVTGLHSDKISALLKEDRGVARIFQRGGGWGGGEVTLCQSEGTHQVVMSFLTPAVGCWHKKVCKRGIHGHPRTPLATPIEYSD